MLIGVEMKFFPNSIPILHPRMRKNPLWLEDGDEPEEKGKDVKTLALKAFGAILRNWPKKENLIRLWVVHLKSAVLRRYFAAEPRIIPFL